MLLTDDCRLEKRRRMRSIVAAAGEIVVVPANTPHGFVNTGEGVLRQVNIHASPRMETEWLE
jgi:mannose-6-phosphate isomerase-like protein (cupin superfamily)